MSCINVSARVACNSLRAHISWVSDLLRAHISWVSDSLRAEVCAVPGIAARAVTDEGISLRVISCSPSLNVKAVAVCDIGTSNYLRVEPTDVVWVSTTTTAVYDVRSNTEWIIE